MFRALIVIGIVALLSACGHDIPPLNFSVPSVGPSATKIDAEVKAITLTVASESQKTGKINPSTDIALPLWKNALEDAFNRMAIFKDDSSKKISVSVTIMQFDAPTAGFEMDTTVTGRYELIDRANGGIIYTQDITTTGKVPADYAFMGVTRARESINRAVQANIEQFLQALQTVDINKPMFPAK